MVWHCMSACLMPGRVQSQALHAAFRAHERSLLGKGPALKEAKLGSGQSRLMHLEKRP